MTYRVSLLHWGEIDYRAAWSRQESIASDVRSGGDDSLILVEHPPVYTYGRRVRPEHLLVAPEALTARGASLVESDRGGDITFHGPGQIVAYPVLDLKRRGIGPNEYVRGLEETVIQALRRFGVTAERSTGRPGVWVGDSKIGAIGVRLRGGVTTHGFALNVETDLSYFEAIVPCGISGAGVTSMKRELGFSPGIAAVQDALIADFENVFASTVRPPISFTESPEFAHLASVTRLTDAGSQPVREVALAHGH